MVQQAGTQLNSDTQSAWVGLTYYNRLLQEIQIQIFSHPSFVIFRYFEYHQNDILVCAWVTKGEKILNNSRVNCLLVYSNFANMLFHVNFLCLLKHNHNTQYEILRKQFCLCMNITIPKERGNDFVFQRMFGYLLFSIEHF